MQSPNLQSEYWTHRENLSVQKRHVIDSYVMTHVIDSYSTCNNLHLEAADSVKLCRTFSCSSNVFWVGKECLVTFVFNHDVAVHLSPFMYKIDGLHFVAFHGEFCWKLSCSWHIISATSNKDIGCFVQRTAKTGEIHKWCDWKGQLRHL